MMPMNISDTECVEEQCKQALQKFLSDYAGDSITSVQVHQWWQIYHSCNERGYTGVSAGGI